MSKMRKHRPHFSKLPSLRQDVPKMWKKSVIWRVRVDLLEHRSPRLKEAVRGAREAMVQAQPKRVGIVARVGTCRPSVPI